MKFNFRLLYWIPVGVFFLLNLLFKFIIFILQNIGNGVVFVNRKIVLAGDYFTDKTISQKSMKNFLSSIEKRKVDTHERVNAKRLR